MVALNHARPEPKFVVVQPQFRRRTLKLVVSTVAKVAGMSMKHLCETGPQSHARFNARAAVAVLAMEFCPDYSDAACDEILRGGERISRYYRSTHADRCALYGDYKSLFIKARIALMAAVHQ